jgi:hypothetical protein
VTVLLNKHNLNIAKLASKEASRFSSRFSLKSIQVSPTETVVTDGHLMMIVSNVDLEADTFPVREDTGIKAVDTFKPFLLSAENALKAANKLPKRSSIRVLQCAAVAVDPADPMAKPMVLTNDLNEQTMYATDEADFPDWQRVLPKVTDTKFSIRLDVRRLATLLNQFISMCDADNKKIPANVRFHFTDKSSPVLMICERNGQTMTGVLCPLRD